MHTKEEFVEIAKQHHGNKYDYSLVEYCGNKKPVIIICPIHGCFEQVPSVHMQGCGCPTCGRLSTANARRSTKDIFIEKARKVHDNKYDYSKVEYMNARTKVCITCAEHGDFWSTPDNHLRGNKCPICAGKTPVTTELFIQRANVIHQDYYDYSETKYINSKEKVCIICPIHGKFYQSPSNHLRGKGCAKCGGTAKISFGEFVEKANQQHSDK